MITTKWHQRFFNFTNINRMIYARRRPVTNVPHKFFVVHNRRSLATRLFASRLQLCVSNIALNLLLGGWPAFVQPIPLSRLRQRRARTHVLEWCTLGKCNHKKFFFERFNDVARLRDVSSWLCWPERRNARVAACTEHCIRGETVV